MNASVIHFGDSDMGDRQILRHLASLVAEAQPMKEENPTPIVVISAQESASELLHLMAESAAKGEAWKELLDSLRFFCLQELDTLSYAPKARRRVEEICAQIGRALRVFPQEEEKVLLATWNILAWGERLAVILLAAALNDQGIAAEAVEEPIVPISLPFPCSLKPRDMPSEIPYAQCILAAPLDKLVYSTDMYLVVDRVVNPLVRGRRVAVVSGSWYQHRQGAYVSSDVVDSRYIAALLSEMVRATKVEMYTHDGGIFTLEPFYRLDTPLVPFLTYDEAWNLSTLGVTPFNAATLRHLAPGRTPLHIRSLVSSRQPGTLIAPAAQQPSQRPVGVLTLQPNVLRYTLKRRWREVGYQEHRAFPLITILSLRSVKENMITLVQPTRSTLSFVIDSAWIDMLDPRFFEENHWKLDIQGGLAVCLCISSELEHHPPIAMSALTALANAGITVFTFSVDEDGLRILVEEREKERALDVLYQAFQDVLIPSSACPEESYNPFL